MGVSEKEDNKTPQMDMRIGYAAYNRLDPAMLTRTNCLKKAGRLKKEFISITVFCLMCQILTLLCYCFILCLLSLVVYFRKCMSGNVMIQFWDC